MTISSSIALKAAKSVYVALWFFLVSYGGAWGQAFEGRELPSPAEIRETYQVALGDEDEVPDLLQSAFVAADDPDFFELPSRQSFFTEQIVKYEFLPFAETPVIRRLRIHLISLRIETTLSHEEILGWYVNRVWLGRGCYGVVDAAFAYFIAR